MKHIFHLIREYQDTDQQTVAKLFNDFQDYLVHLDSFNILHRSLNYGDLHLKKTLDLIKKSHGKFLVYELDGKVVGFIAGTIKKTDEKEKSESLLKQEGEVVELYLDPKYRSVGIGSKLMDEIEQYFKEQNCEAIFIDVFVPNVLGSKFYEKH